MRIPEGDLLRSRVAASAADPLEAALDSRLTGYAVLEPRDALLLDESARGVLTFEAGVPVLAYHTGADAGGPAALAALATPGPYRVELYELPAGELTEPHEAEGLRVPPGMPAERLAGAPDLADRTRRRAPDRDAGGGSAVEAFLADEERVAAIREQAREEAERRAEEWGLEDALAGGDDVGGDAGGFQFGAE